MKFMDHRGAETTIKILESFSSCMTSNIKVGKKRSWVINYLEKEMRHDIPCDATVKSILGELENNGYLERRKEKNAHRWYPTEKLKKLADGDISKSF